MMLRLACIKNQELVYGKKSQIHHFFQKYMELVHEIAQKVEDQLDFQYPDDLRR